MSTKIYNGYRLRFNDWIALLAWFKTVQLKFEDLKRELIIKQHSEILDKKSYHDIWQSLTDRALEIKRTNIRDPDADFNAEVTVFPLPQNSKKILAMSFWDNNDYTKLWESLTGVEEYAYYNNADRPENITKKQWQQREFDWNEALPLYSSTPSKCGFSIVLTDYRIPGFYDLTEWFKSHRVKLNL